MSREGHNSERNRRLGNISNIPMILVILVPHAFEMKMVALNCICIMIYLIVFLSVFENTFIFIMNILSC